jgi:hypothetical protein
MVVVEVVSARQVVTARQARNVIVAALVVIKFSLLKFEFIAE